MSKLYNPSIIETIKNVRHQYNCGLLTAKRLTERYRDVFQEDILGTWANIKPEHFDFFVGLFGKTIVEYYESEAYDLIRLRSLVSDHNYKFGTNYIIVRDNDF